MQRNSDAFKHYPIFKSGNNELLFKSPLVS